MMHRLLRSLGGMLPLAAVGSYLAHGCGSEFQAGPGDPQDAGGCPANWGDCDGVGGCETDLLGTAEHCGSCETNCSAAGWPDVASYACDEGHCVIAECAEGHAHCDGESANGCEIDADVDPANCGDCGNACLGGECLGGRCVRSLYAAHAFANWGANVSGAAQWSTPWVINPNDDAAEVTVRVHQAASSDSLYSFSKTIAPQAVWTGYGDADWQALPSTSGMGSIGWVELRSVAELVATNSVEIRQGSVFNGPVMLRDFEPFTATLSHSLSAWSFLKNWTSPTEGDSTHRQWTSLVLCNPNDTEAVATIAVRDHETGALVGSFDKTIAAWQWWNAYADESWDGVGEASVFGWVDVESTLPLLGTNRWLLTDGSTYHSSLTLFDDLTMAVGAATAQIAPLYVKRWPSGLDRSQWSFLVVDNPNDEEAAVTVTVHSGDGAAVLGQFTKTITARGIWTSKGDALWNDIDDSDSANQRSIGWVEVTSNLPVAASNVIDIVAGTEENGAIVVRDVNRLSQGALTAYASVYLRNADVGDGTGRRAETSIAIANPNDQPVTLAVTVRGADSGEELRTFAKEVAPKAWWNSFDDDDWTTVPPTDGDRCVGWVTVTATAPIAGSLRYRLIDGAGQVVLVDEQPMLVAGE